MAEGGVKKKKGPVGKKGKKGKKDGPGAVAEVNLKTQGLFAKDLRVMMYGYGDAPAPYRETVDLVESIVVEYATVVAAGAMDAAVRRGGKLVPDDLLFFVRKDPKKFSRAIELMRMNEEIKEAKKVFNAEEDVDEPE